MSLPALILTVAHTLLRQTTYVAQLFFTNFENVKNQVMG
jgi:hypothetical protein